MCVNRSKHVLTFLSIIFVVGDVGGQLGLVLGASVITLLEVVDLVVCIIFFWLQSKYRSWKGK